jgi:hypothetical protein
MPKPDPRIAALEARLELVEAALAERSRLIGLKDAARQSGVEYERARRLCAKQLVGSKKIGGRVFANPNDLVMHAKRRG